MGGNDAGCRNTIHDCTYPEQQSTINHGQKQIQLQSTHTVQPPPKNMFQLTVLKWHTIYIKIRLITKSVGIIALTASEQ